MHSETPKHLHPLLGRRLVDWVAEAALSLDPDRLVIVTSPAEAGSFARVGGAVQLVRRDQIAEADRRHCR